MLDGVDSKDQGGASARVRSGAPPTLADHFVTCSKLGRYLTLPKSRRFVISDDVTGQTRMRTDAIAIASICSRDALVAQAAMLPLGRAALASRARKRAQYEELFDLIERQALDADVKTTAQGLLEEDFAEARIRALQADIGAFVSPARMRYRAFLEVVGELVKGRVSSGYFLDEFADFTKAVAGRLDFGIYSFCLDRLFALARIPMKVKKMLVAEILVYPPLIRRELLSNLLTNAQAGPGLIDFSRQVMHLNLSKTDVLEIELLEAVKNQRITMGEIETRFAQNAES
ncbi:hypothetical protein [Varunaivibrio sulfuroxidans]|uniref:Uncharacterized protein n=1 Tax=Varunaivibrio sulfuroxidans TaxID=1773489 RepID=A0A4R3JAP8_9PROT|nr:hypothetical protein [Varunaivibrio sulfuroxidans]TCS63069.1 hypothetical protein EDD55_104160 [Varunaivibrio sulfuroxidans]WES31859.1 hypothetical protein P3M64_05745 [Varunaivibrio sulfuroxidans]